MGLAKAPMRRRSWSSWMIFPGVGSALPIRLTPLRTMVLGWDCRKGFSMFRPFWIRTMAVVVLTIVPLLLVYLSCSAYI